MTASFPDSIKTFTTLVDDFDIAEAVNINEPYEEITAIETYLLSGVIKGRNFITNPTGVINQRSTAYTLVKDAYSWDSSQLYGPDRWEGMATGTAVSAGTFTSTASANCGVTGNALIFSGVTLTGSGVVYLRHRIESADAKKLKNQTASFSAKVYQDTGGALNYTVYIRKANAADNFSAVTAISNSGAVSIPDSTETSLEYENITMGDCSNGVEIEIVVTAGAITTKAFEFTELKLEIGETATQFEPRLYTEELALCLRSCFVITKDNHGSYIIPVGGRISTNYLGGQIMFKQRMRAAPTLTHNISAWSTDATPLTTTIGAYDYVAAGMVTITGTVSMAVAMGTDCGRLLAQASTSFSGTAGSFCDVRIGADVKLVFSCEL